MPYLTSLLLDWGNDALVHLRLGRRQPVVDRERLEAYVAAPPEPLHPEPGPGALTPRPVDGDGHVPRSTWRAASPWPGVTAPGDVWYATRHAAGDAESHGGSPPAVVLLHGWLVSRAQLAVYRRLARGLVERGVEVWVPRLPWHMERTPPGRWSGELCLSSDLVRSVEALRQAVFETRALGRWLGQRGAPAVALWGTSLGGWVAGLAATLQEWDGVALWAPVADPEQILFEARVARDLRRALQAADVTRGADAVALDVLAPGATPLRLASRSVLLVGGIHDRLVYADAIARLARSWGVAVRWAPHGHISLMLSPAETRHTTGFLERRLAEAT